MGSRARWMAGKYGLMVHYLPPELYTRAGRKISDVDRAVDSFDVAGFVRDFERTGAEWLIFTFGQNTGFYCSPNAVIDRYAGMGHCSQRDLMLELAQALDARGKRLIGYLPCEVNANPSLHAGFGWNTLPGTDQGTFQMRYLEAVRFWAEKFGSLLSGWWFDGCYTWEVFHNKHMQWDCWFLAARVGNSEALVTFNDGCFCVGHPEPIRSGFDYFAGEVAALYRGKAWMGKNFDTFTPAGASAPGDPECLQHCLAPIDAMWAHNTPVGDWLPEWATLTQRPAPMEPPAYGDGELMTLLGDFCGQGGAVTFNVGVFADGGMGPETVAQLERLSGRFRRG